MDNAIKELEKLGSRHVTIENIRNLVNQKDVILEHDIQSNEDEIKIKSVEMLDKLTYAFLKPSPNGGVLN